MISVRLWKTFAGGPESRAFQLDAQFESNQGVAVLFGPSGSGKTLTLDCIAGFVTPDRGRILMDDAILFDGKARVNMPPRERHCGYVFQNYALFPHMSLRENLEFACAASKLEQRKRVNQSLERFRLAEVAGRRPHELSGGQKQRGSIARALLANPRLLLLDEPAQGLDALLRQELYEVLRTVRREDSIPALLVTHDLDEALELGEQMHVFSEGRVVQSGPPRELLRAPANEKIARLLGIYNLFAAEILSLDPSRNYSRLRIGEWMVEGSYYPGHLIGDRITLYSLPSDVRVSARESQPGSGQMAAELQHAVEGPVSTRLVFKDGLRAEVPGAEWERLRGTREFLLEIPPRALRILKA